MRTQVSKLGNNLAICIPKVYAEVLGLSEGAAVDVELSGRKLILTPEQPAYELDSLVAGITPENRHAETDWGKGVGKETWRK